MMATCQCDSYCLHSISCCLLFIRNCWYHLNTSLLCYSIMPAGKQSGFIINYNLLIPIIVTVYVHGLLSGLFD